jgi:hypothetical protein
MAYATVQLPCSRVLCSRLRLEGYSRRRLALRRIVSYPHNEHSMSTPARQVVDEETVDSPPLAGGALQRAPQPLPFSVGDGAMLDLSLKGGRLAPAATVPSTRPGQPVQP